MRRQIKEIEFDSDEVASFDDIYEIQNEMGDIAEDIEEASVVFSKALSELSLLFSGIAKDSAPDKAMLEVITKFRELDKAWTTAWNEMDTELYRVQDRLETEEQED